jgi:hypothetical protein
MNVFQNILDVFVIKDVGQDDAPVISAHKTADEAEAEKKRLLKEGDYMLLVIHPRKATNINGEWHLLGNIITL